MYFLFFLSLLLSTNVFAGNGCTNEEFAKRISKNLPGGSELLISRITECNHWAGEDPYDKERAAFIQKAVKEAKCDSIENDKDKLLKKYPKKPEIKKAFDSAENWDGGSCE